MSSEMSTQYLLTMITDRCKELIKLTKRLEKQDAEWTSTIPQMIQEIKMTVPKYKDVIENRRNEILRSNGGNPEIF